MSPSAVEPHRRAYQVAAIPMRLGEERRVEICLVTSRSTGRWIIPKGWPMKGRTDSEAASIEAKEEAGVVGSMLPTPLGSYTYWRRTSVDFRLTRVDAYVLRVKRLKRRWKEQKERRVMWVKTLEAADLVLEPELSTLLLSLPSHKQACDFIGKGERILF